MNTLIDFFAYSVGWALSTAAPILIALCVAWAACKIFRIEIR